MNMWGKQQTKETKAIAERQGHLRKRVWVLAHSGSLGWLTVCVFTAAIVAGLGAQYIPLHAQNDPATLVPPKTDDRSNGRSLFLPSIQLAGKGLVQDTGKNTLPTLVPVPPTKTPVPSTSTLPKVDPTATPTPTKTKVTTPPPTPTTPPTPTAAPTATATTTSAFPCDLNAQESAIADLLSTHPDQGRPELHCHGILAQVARERAEDMGLRDYFSHVNPDGQGPNYLVSQAGYELPTWYLGSISANYIESIAAGYQDAGTTWQAWMDSEPHLKHLLGSDLFYASQTEYGIGYADVPGSRYQRYWVVITAPSPESQ